MMGAWYEHGTQLYSSSGFTAGYTSNALISALRFSFNGGNITEGAITAFKVNRS
jgi:hypothetical protein